MRGPHRLYFFLFKSLEFALEFCQEAQQLHYLVLAVVELLKGCAVNIHLDVIQKCRKYSSSFFANKTLAHLNLLLYQSLRGVM